MSAIIFMPDSAIVLAEVTILYRELLIKNANIRQLEGTAHLFKMSLETGTG